MRSSTLELDHLLPTLVLAKPLSILNNGFNYRFSHEYIFSKPMNIFAHNDNYYQQSETLQMASVFIFWLVMSIYAIVNLFSGEFLLALGWFALSIPLGAVIYVISTVM